MDETRNKLNTLLWIKLNEKASYFYWIPSDAKRKDYAWSIFYKNIT